MSNCGFSYIVHEVKPVNHALCNYDISVSTTLWCLASGNATLSQGIGLAK